MVTTRSMLKRPVRFCRRNKTTPATNQDYGKTPYLCRDLTHSKFVKLGCSSNPYRRVNDTSFGKTPRVIRRSMKTKKNRFIDTIFVPTVKAVCTGEYLERYFHKYYEEQHTVGEWLCSTLRPVITRFFEKRGWIATPVCIRGL